jgi:hypothetical protein
LRVSWLTRLSHGREKILRHETHGLLSVLPTGFRSKYAFWPVFHAGTVIPSAAAAASLSAAVTFS